MVLLPKGRGGESGDRSCGSGIEGLRGSGELLAKAECEPTQRAASVQGGAGYRYSNLGGKVGAAVGGDFTRDAVPGVPGGAEGVQFPG